MAAVSKSVIREPAAKRRLAAFLDDLIPLRDATHADVVAFHVDIPMRYAECFARLKDGRTVRLRDKRRFVGWTGYRQCRSLLFRSDGLQLVVDVGESEVSGPVRDLHLQTEPARLSLVKSGRADIIRKFIGIDGDLVRVNVTQGMANPPTGQTGEDRR